MNMPCRTCKNKPTGSLESSPPAKTAAALSGTIIVLVATPAVSAAGCFNVSNTPVVVTPESSKVAALDLDVTANKKRQKYEFFLTSFSFTPSQNKIFQEYLYL